MFFIHGMGRFWGLAEDKMPVAAPEGDKDPTAQRGFPCRC